MVSLKKAKKASSANAAHQTESKPTSSRKRKLGVEAGESGDATEEKKIPADEAQRKIGSCQEADPNKVQEMKEQGRVAINALKKHYADRSGKSLFPDIDQAVGVTVVYKKPTLNTDKARVKIILPCSHRTPTDTSVCLIMPDLDQTAAGRTEQGEKLEGVANFDTGAVDGSHLELLRDPDVDKQARQWAEMVEKDHGLTSQNYAKIMTKRQIEREYHSFAQRRAFATTYDVFLVDVRVGKAVRTFLGKEFYKVHKEPLDFNYSKPLVTAIENAVKTTVLKLQRYATRVNVAFGHLGQQLSDLSLNFNAVVDAVLKASPGGLSNIRSVYIQPVGSSPSLPVYVDSGSASEVHLDKPETRRRSMEQVTDECSTLPDGLKLAVRKNGKLRVVSEDTGHTVHYPTVLDEWEERDGLKPTIDPAKLKRKHASKKKRMQKRLAQRKIKSGETVAVRHDVK